MKILSVRVLLCVVVLFVSLTGCRDENVGQSKGVVEKADSNILAVVGDEVITRADLAVAMERIPEARRERLRLRVLDDLIRAKVFSAEAIDAGLENDPKIKEELDTARDDTLARLFVRKHVDREAEPSDEEVRRYFDDHKKEFVASEGVLVQQIRVKKPEDARAVLDELKAGTSFAELAKKKSTARSWKEGGSMGWQYKGWMEPAVEKVAFGLEKGKVSDIIETKKGYEIVKVLDKKEKREAPFEEAEANIRSRLFSMRKKELADQYYEKAGVNSAPAEKGALARIGEETITEETLAPKLAEFSEKEKEKAKKRWIDYLIEKKVFSDEAEKVDLQSDPEVAAELRVARERILAAAFYARSIKDELQISDEEIRGYYGSHRDEFAIPVRLRVKSILVKTREEAQEILKELDKGASFGNLAIEHSLYPSASRRAGEIGWFSEGEKDPALEEVAFALEKGERSDIIKTEAGYEIIKLMDRKGGNIKTLDQVRQAIKMSLFRQKFEEEKQRYYKKAGVKVLGS